VELPAQRPVVGRTAARAGHFGRECDRRLQRRAASSSRWSAGTPSWWNPIQPSLIAGTRAPPRAPPPSRRPRRRPRAPDGAAGSPSARSCRARREAVRRVAILVAVVGVQVDGNEMDATYPHWSGQLVDELVAADAERAGRSRSTYRCTRAPRRHAPPAARGPPRHRMRRRTSAPRRGAAPGKPASFLSCHSPGRWMSVMLYLNPGASTS